MRKLMLQELQDFEIVGGTANYTECCYNAHRFVIEDQSWSDLLYSKEFIIGKTLGQSVLLEKICGSKKASVAARKAYCKRHPKAC